MAVLRDRRPPKMHPGCTDPLSLKNSEINICTRIYILPKLTVNLEDIVLFARASSARAARCFSDVLFLMSCFRYLFVVRIRV